MTNEGIAKIYCGNSSTKRVFLILSIAILHLGMWNLTASAPKIRTPPKLFREDNKEILLTFFSEQTANPANSKLSTASIARVSAAPKRKVVPLQIETVKKSTRSGETQDIFILPSGGNSMSSTIVEQGPVPLNIDQLKMSAAKFAAAESRKGIDTDAALKQKNNIAEKAIRQAARPKCDNDYVAAVGNVEFKGLMKLPFLVRSAASDKGCKW